MTNGKRWMRNLPAFPVALRQTFQCSWLFHFPLVTKVFVCIGTKTISSLLRLSALFQTEHTTSIGKYVHQFPFSFISCLPLRFFFSFSCRLIWLSLQATTINSTMQLWPIFWTYLERRIPRYDCLNCLYTARGQVGGLRMCWSFCWII